MIKRYLGMFLLLILIEILSYIHATEDSASVITTEAFPYQNKSITLDNKQESPYNVTFIKNKKNVLAEERGIEQLRSTNIAVMERVDPIVLPLMQAVDAILSVISAILDIFLFFQKQQIQAKMNEIMEKIQVNFKAVTTELNEINEMVQLRGKEYYYKTETAVFSAIDDMENENTQDIASRGVNLYSQILAMLNGLLGTTIVFPDLLDLLRQNAKGDVEVFHYLMEKYFNLIRFGIIGLSYYDYKLKTPETSPLRGEERVKFLGGVVKAAMKRASLFEQKMAEWNVEKINSYISRVLNDSRYENLTMELMTEVIKQKLESYFADTAAFILFVTPNAPKPPIEGNVNPSFLDHQAIKHKLMGSRFWEYKVFWDESLKNIVVSKAFNVYWISKQMSFRRHMKYREALINDTKTAIEKELDNLNYVNYWLKDISFNHLFNSMETTNAFLEKWLLYLPDDGPSSRTYPRFPYSSLVVSVRLPSNNPFILTTTSHGFAITKNISVDQGSSKSYSYQVGHAMVVLKNSTWDSVFSCGRECERKLVFGQYSVSWAIKEFSNDKFKYCPYFLNDYCDRLLEKFNN